MKKEIHPEYYPDAIITCACGASMKVGSTKKNMSIEICSQCHPFYTGKKKTIDTTGRVGRFKKLAEKSAAKKEAVSLAKASLAESKRAKKTKLLKKEKGEEMKKKAPKKNKK